MALWVSILCPTINRGFGLFADFHLRCPFLSSGCLRNGPIPPRAASLRTAAAGSAPGPPGDPGNTCPPARLGASSSSSRPLCLLLPGGSMSGGPPPPRKTVKAALLCSFVAAEPPPPLVQSQPVLQGVQGTLISLHTPEEYFFTVAIEAGSSEDGVETENRAGYYLREGQRLRTEDPGCGCCQQSISTRGKHSIPLSLRAEGCK
ncbi:unnamed protein product [Boreogadus saida]